MTVSDPNSYNVVQSWIKFVGAADDGTDIYGVVNVNYGGDIRAPKTDNTAKGCGTVTDFSPTGYGNFLNGLNSPCGLYVDQTISYKTATKLTHSMSAILT